ncbi:histidinol-phosphate transaminase [Pseudothermotoga sp. U03pept]|uniref:histidinol-phosphate transaminase n=1 Tax=Pseudothermotoga sp. U03pept TaxID=3447012 RepID=UPI003F077640
MNPIDLVTKRVSPYAAEKRSTTYLALNENPFPFPEELLQEALKRMQIDNLRIYYDSPSEELVEAILQYVGADFITERNVSIGNGADEIIYVMMTIFDRVFFFPPTYSCYKIFAQALNVKYIELPLEEDLHIPEVDLKEGDLVFIPNPNNPTGHLFEREEIEYILKKGAFLALDEAYYEFSKVTYLELLKKYDNIAILRTFSKAFSLAAQRIGYIISSEKFIDTYNRVRLPYNVSYLSQLLAKTALDHVKIFQERTEFIVQERERMKDSLKAMGYSLTDSFANFVFVFIEKKKRDRLIKDLSKKGITIRSFDEGVRISVGTEEQNNMILKELEVFR